MIRHPCVPARRRAAAAAAVLLALAAPPAGATADGPDYFRVAGVAADDLLNVRERPDARARRLAALPPDATGLRNLGCRGGLSFSDWQNATEAERSAAARRRWCRIDWRGIQGWVAARFLVEDTRPPATPGVRWRGIDGAPPDAELTFASDGGLAGSTGCNRLQGRVTLGDGRLMLDGPLATTRRACPGTLLVYEQRLMRLLEAGPAVVFDPVQDTMTLEALGDRLRFAR
ncbi:MAG: META domain-containing protein [Pseudomonadota bacterium]